jgi:hypothetical protein
VEAAATINEDGTRVLIEALYARHYGLYISDDHETLEDAVGYLESGADYGECAPIGVLVEGEPRTYGSFNPHVPTGEQADEMRRLYRLVKENGDGVAVP